MSALAYVGARYPRAIERDLLSMGYRYSDIGTRLSFDEFASIVLAPPGAETSAVRFATSQGWSREAHLLASLGEQQAGVLALNSRYERPGVDTQSWKDATPNPSHTTVTHRPGGVTIERPFNGMAFDAMTPDELAAKRAKHLEQKRAEGKL